MTRRVALVTGSATGVGRAAAVRFAANGFDVAINFTKSESEALHTLSLVEAEGAHGTLLPFDVSDDQAARNAIEAIEKQWGRLDVLVNNAGCTAFVEHSDLEGMTEQRWDRILGVNLKGPFFVTRAAADLLRRTGDAAVVNVSSVAAIAGMGSSIAYCASKGALNTMTKSLARVLAPEVRVNAVCPGPIDTRWLREWKTGEEIQAWVQDYPIPRAAQPDDIADTIYYLACGTSLTTGQCLVVDGGRTM